MDVDARFDELMAFVLGPRPDEDEDAPSEEHEREKGDDDAVEYGDPRDRRDELRYED